MVVCGGRRTGEKLSVAGHVCAVINNKYSAANINGCHGYYAKSKPRVNKPSSEDQSRTEFAVRSVLVSFVIWLGVLGFLARAIDLCRHVMLLSLEHQAFLTVSNEGQPLFMGGCLNTVSHSSAFVDGSVKVESFQGCITTHWNHMTLPSTGHSSHQSGLPPPSQILVLPTLCTPVATVDIGKITLRARYTVVSKKSAAITEHICSI